jgi:5-methylcytosine-specific restriction protein A
MRKYICNHPGCSELLNERGYCSKHKKESIPFANAIRSNNYNNSKWRKLRANHIRNNPECCICGTTIGLTVDHIIPPIGNEELFYDESNLQTLCQEHHRLKTAAEIRDRRNKNDGQ